jgi:hypothetical protein
MEKQKLINFLEDHAIIKFEAEEESIEVRGNCLASGSDEEDKKEEDAILKRLAQNDIAAWFCAKVTATYDNFHGTDYLGACSYNSLEEFTEEKNGYYADMIARAIDDLATQIMARKYDLNKIEKELAYV